MKIKMTKDGQIKMIDGAARIELLKYHGWKVDGEKEEKSDEVDALRAEAEALGLKPHHKAGAEKLKEMIAEAKA